jgi:hypothetical protein
MTLLFGNVELYQFNVVSNQRIDPSSVLFHGNHTWGMYTFPQGTTLESITGTIYRSDNDDILGIFYVSGDCIYRYAPRNSRLIGYIGRYSDGTNRGFITLSVPNCLSSCYIICSYEIMQYARDPNITVWAQRARREKVDWSKEGF